MAKAQNTFLGSKMNKDIDARLLQNGDYRNALNVQISRSEGDGVGSLENILGNSLAVDFETLTGISNLTCIGFFSDDINNIIYLFLTDYTDLSPDNYIYSKDANNFIYAYNTVSLNATKLVEGNWLNFSKTNFIYAANVLEDFLFWTDNRNQPRKINTVSAFGSSSYYQTEDQISVSTYNPYQSILLFRQSLLTTGDSAYETTMLDVVSKFYPNGGSATATPSTYAAGTNVPITSIKGNIYIGATLKSSITPTVILASTKVDKIENANPPTFIQLDKAVTIHPDDVEIVFEPNPYFEPSYNGDPNYLEDKFVRFGYRFNYVDGENSIFSPFTQPAFVPKQDGYFITDKTLLTGSAPQAGEVYASREKNDQKLSYQSTIVEFMENKVNKILLYVPLPFNNYDLLNALKVDSIDILYKESNQTSVKVIEQVSAETIFNSAGEAEATAAVTNTTGPFAVQNVKGGILVGSQVTFPGNPQSAITVTAWSPTNPAVPTSGNITLSDPVTLAQGDIIIIGNPKFYIYDYQSRKPFKVLPEADLIRVYDKTPVRSLSQEVISNRVVYGNFQNKHTPPASLDYNVNTGPKVSFLINTGSATALAIGTDKTKVNLDASSKTGTIWNSNGIVVGSIVTSPSSGANIPPGTVVQFYDPSTNVLTLTNSVSYSAGDIIELAPASDVQDATSIIEYPNHSVKQNRNYQVGFVLSDRYGRQSSVVLSDSLNAVISGGVEFKGSTIYSSYNNNSVQQARWPGDSLKISFNSPIGPVNKNASTGWPGLFNGDPTSNSYNPLGWYSYKIVVKQTEQEYYNVYLPGVMAAYPEDLVKELGKTSHTVLINDNINKIPRDLNEVGPQQKQFRSSVEIFGRVENNVSFPATYPNLSKNSPYYPGIKPDTVSVISTLNDLFDFSPLVSKRPDFFPQFYAFNSDPLIARISTENKLGQIANTEFDTASGIVDIQNTPPPPGVPPSAIDNFLVTLKDIKGTISPDMLVRGGGLAEGTEVINVALSVVQLSAEIGTASGTADNIFSQGDVLTFFKNPEVDPPGIQYLAVYETTPVESLLDIFWETSSSGLISELNLAVLSENSGGFNLIGFNSNLFFENLASGGDIIQGTAAAPGITVQNVFGADLDPTTFTLTLASPNGDASVTDLAGNDRSDEFQLVETSTSGFYQIKTTTLFSFNADSAERTFFFNIAATNVGDGTSSFFLEPGTLKNSPPVFLSLNNPANRVSILPGTASTLPVPFVPDVTIESYESLVINKIEGENGSAFFSDGTTGPTGNKFKSAKDLNIEIFRQIRATSLLAYGGGYPEQDVIFGESVNPFTGTTQYFDETGIIFGGSSFGPGFETNLTTATSNLVNNGVSFATLTKPSASKPFFYEPDKERGYIDAIVYLKITDASEVPGSLTSEDAAGNSTLCRVFVRVNYSLLPSFTQTFITPSELATGSNTHVDATAEIATNGVISATQLKLINLSGADVFYGAFFIFGESSDNVARGPIWNAGPALGEEGPNGNQIYSSNANAYFTNVPSAATGPTNWWPPNAQILRDVGGVLTPTGLRVKSVSYTNPPAFGTAEPGESIYGTEATIETFDNLSGAGFQDGDIISFTSGRWLVTAPNQAGNIITDVVFPRKLIGMNFPVISATTGTNNTQQELCNLVTNASPAKTANCSFVNNPALTDPIIPAFWPNGNLVSNPDDFIPGHRYGFMVSPGTETSGTIDGCLETCTPNE
jgi:hypothetical protein